jgi:hypothetical protein
VFAQRREQQGAVDLAALAAANDFLINGSWSGAVDRAEDVAKANGFDEDAPGVDVDVDVDLDNGVQVHATITAPHHNMIVGVLGMPTWTVSVTGTAQAGFPDTAYGAAPFVFAASAFAADGTPHYQTPTDFGETNGDVPTSSLDIAWTNYGTGNVSTSEVSQIIRGDLVIDKTLQFGEYIGQKNSGNHTALFDDVDAYISGRDLPTPVVDANGNFVGWSVFHVISASGGATKHIRGYFVSSFQSSSTAITACAANNCPRYLGAYVLKLTN